MRGGTAAPKTPDGYKYLRRRAASPGTMRHNHIKDDLALLMKKHTESIEKEYAKEERLWQAGKGRLEWDAMIRSRETIENDAGTSLPVVSARQQGQQLKMTLPPPPLPTQEELLWHTRLVAGRFQVNTTTGLVEAAAGSIYTASAACTPAAGEEAKVQQDTARPMAELHEIMKDSFRHSLSKVGRKKADPLEQRLVDKQATDAQRSSLLRTMAALRGQRYRMTQRFAAEEVDRAVLRPAPVSRFVVNTKWGELAGGDSEEILGTGDGDTWLAAALEAKQHVFLGLSDMSATLISYMPPLADIAHQRAQLEEERLALVTQLEVRL